MRLLLMIIYMDMENNNNKIYSMYLVWLYYLSIDILELYVVILHTADPWMGQEGSKMSLTYYKGIG